MRERDVNQYVGLVPEYIVLEPEEKAFIQIHRSGNQLNGNQKYVVHIRYRKGSHLEEALISAEKPASAGRIAFSIVESVEAIRFQTSDAPNHLEKGISCGEDEMLQFVNGYYEETVSGVKSTLPEPVQPTVNMRTYMMGVLVQGHQL